MAPGSCTRSAPISFFFSPYPINDGIIALWSLQQNPPNCFLTLLSYLPSSDPLLILSIISFPPRLSPTTISPGLGHILLLPFIKNQIDLLSLMGLPTS